LLALIDGLLGRARRAAAPGLHLDEDEGTGVHRNEIDFRSGGPKIPRHDPVAVAPQILLGSALASAPKREPDSN
jgi:hypothetical protein